MSKIQSARSEEAQPGKVRWCLIILLFCGLFITFSSWRSWRTPALEPTLTQSVSAMPPLQGAAAVEHLKQQGLYASLNDAMTATRYGVKAVSEERWREHGANYVVFNPAQQLRSTFSAEGPELQSATPHGQPWRLGMKLRSAGYGNQQIKVSSGAVTAQGNRIEYRREVSNKQQVDGNQSRISDPQSEIVEWYVNKPSGLEQGFTLAKQLGDRRAGEALQLTVELESELRARAVADGQAVEFVDAAGIFMFTKTDPDEIQSYLTDASHMLEGHAERVLFPESAEEVAEILQTATRDQTRGQSIPERARQ